MATPEVALRKRQQITKANRTMFIWVAVVSAIIGFASVGAILLWQKIAYNEKVLSEKSETAKVLASNIEAIKQLEDKIRVHNTSQALRDSSTDDENQPLRVILDALPSEPNSSALGASLQERFLNQSGLTIESLTVTPIDGEEVFSEEEGIEDAELDPALAEEEGSVAQQIQFSFSVSTSSDKIEGLQDLLQRLERSIRTVNITTMKLEYQGTRMQLTVDGVAYYEPAKTAELKEKVVEIK